MIEQQSRILCVIGAAVLIAVCALYALVGLVLTMCFKIPRWLWEQAERLRGRKEVSREGERQERKVEGKRMNLQARYWRWHDEGLDLAFLLVAECKELLTKVMAVFQNDPDPQVRCERWVKFVDDDIFVSAWLDDQGRPCCWAKIDGDHDDGMAWRVEFLDLDRKRALHQLLTAKLSEVTASEGGVAADERRKQILSDRGNVKELARNATVRR